MVNEQLRAIPEVRELDDRLKKACELLKEWMMAEIEDARGPMRETIDFLEGKK